MIRSNWNSNPKKKIIVCYSKECRTWDFDPYIYKCPLDFPNPFKPTLSHLIFPLLDIMLYVSNLFIWPLLIDIIAYHWSGLFGKHGMSEVIFITFGNLLSCLMFLGFYVIRIHLGRMIYLPLKKKEKKIHPTYFFIFPHF